MTLSLVRRGVLSMALVLAAAPLGTQPAPAGAPAADEMARTLGQGLGVTRDSALEARTREVSKGLRCPVCRGESIQDSPAELSAQMRNVVREQLANGKTPDEVRQYFTDKYGEWILLQPKAEGVNLLVYLLPALFVVGGGVVVLRVARRWVRGTTAEVASP
jgi:cytochrome c-type biogenesis protein CcmH/NrfF